MSNTDNTDISEERERELIAQLRDFRTRIDSELSRVIIGQKDVVRQLLVSMLAGGNCLITGAPGLAKTLLVKTIADLFNLNFSRIQFTPDLMPADITGTEVLEEDAASARSMRFIPGPIFSNVLLADEINRASPRTQSALLEAMQERKVTAAGHTYDLPAPFFVLATQNPIEQEGTYPLPEAQLDRFLFKLVVGYSGRAELSTIVDRTTRGFQDQAEKVMDGAEIVEWQKLVREVMIAPHVQDYLVRLTLATHPEGPFAAEVTNQYLRWGSSPRGAQTLALASKVRALLDGRFNVSFEDLRRVYLPTMRHRVILNFEAQAEGMTTDDVLLELLEKVPEQVDDIPVASTV